MRGTAEKQEQFIQVGVTAARDPKTGGFLPAVPLFIREDDQARACEEELIMDIGKLLAARMREYKQACKAEGVTA